MKKVLITILISVLTGAGFAFIIFKNINKDVDLAIASTNELTFFQTGVFKNEENANNYMQNFKSSIIIKDKDYYRVIIAILSNKEAISLEENYLKEKGINYYLKKENIANEKLVKEIQEYEKLIISAKSDTYEQVNKDILKLYESSKS